MNQLYQELINSINRTSEKHPEYSMQKHLYGCLKQYYNSLYSSPVTALNNFYIGFSRTDKNNNPVRARLMDYMVSRNKDGALEFFRLIYSFCIKMVELNSNRKLKDENLFKYSCFYINEYNKVTSENDIESIRDKIYDNPNLLSGLMHYIQPLIGYFTKAISIKKETVKSGIIFTDITSTANQVITNVDRNVIKDSFGATLKNGRIQVASYIGKKNRQEDAVLSMTRGNCSLNIVADGISGSGGGHLASIMVVKEMCIWFNELNLDYIPQSYNSVKDAETSTLFKMITKKLQEINFKINYRYEGKNPPGTTVVIAFSTPAYTLIINVGDSTAYLKNGQDIKLLTQIDAAGFIDKSIIEDYEKYRNVFGNNIVTRFIGCGTNQVKPHGYSLDHSVPRKILLSSDGVTDLINEDNFKRLFLGNATAKDFVDKALNPDPHIKPKDGSYQELSNKSTDNISAILIDIPKNSGRSL